MDVHLFLFVFGFWFLVNSNNNTFVVLCLFYKDRMCSMCLYRFKMPDLLKDGCSHRHKVVSNSKNRSKTDMIDAAVFFFLNYKTYKYVLFAKINMLFMSMEAQWSSG